MNWLDPDLLQQGDKRAVDAFLRVIRGRIRRFFKKPSQIADVAGAVLIDLLERLGKGEVPENPRYWALNVTNNVVRRELTRIKKRFQAYQSQIHGNDGTDHDATLATELEFRKVEKLITELDETSAQVLTAAAQGFTYREIAEELDSTTGSVRMTLSRARASLKSQLSAQEQREMLVMLARQAGLLDAPSLPADESTPTPDSNAS